jgi:hypothetical protein
MLCDGLAFMTMPPPSGPGPPGHTIPVEVETLDKRRHETVAAGIMLFPQNTSSDHSASLIHSGCHCAFRRTAVATTARRHVEATLPPTRRRQNARINTVDSWTF